MLLAERLVQRMIYLGLKPEVCCGMIESQRSGVQCGGLFRGLLPPTFGQAGLSRAETSRDRIECCPGNRNPSSSSSRFLKVILLVARKMLLEAHSLIGEETLQDAIADAIVTPGERCLTK